MDLSKMNEAELNYILASVTALAEAKEKFADANVGADLPDAETSARAYAERRKNKGRGQSATTDKLGEAILESVAEWRKRTNRIRPRD